MISFIVVLFIWFHEMILVRNLQNATIKHKLAYHPTFLSKNSKLKIQHVRNRMPNYAVPKIVCDFCWNRLWVLLHEICSNFLLLFNHFLVALLLSKSCNNLCNNIYFCTRAEEFCCNTRGKLWWQTNSHHPHHQCIPVTSIYPMHTLLVSNLCRLLLGMKALICNCCGFGLFLHLIYLCDMCDEFAKTFSSIDIYFLVILVA